MNSEAALPKLVLLLLFSSGLAQSAFACHKTSADATALQRKPDTRTFLLDLQLSKSGAFRGVQVLMGAWPLRTRAIRAATRRRYHARIGYNPNVAAVQVKFPEGRNAVPEIREAMVGGVSSCVYGGTPIQWPLIPWVNQMLSSMPVVPIVEPAISVQAITSNCFGHQIGFRLNRIIHLARNLGNFPPLSSPVSLVI